MKKVSELFGGRLRVRVSGICVENGRLLLVGHNGLSKTGKFWAPPGGEVHFREEMETALQREFREEVNLQANVAGFLCVNEFMSGKLHAVELFFRVKIPEGSPEKGIDPELKKDEQLIEEVRFMTFDELNKLPDANKHNLLHGNLSESKLLNKNGYFKFVN